MASVNTNHLVEVWRDVVGYEEIYSVSNLGNIKSKTRRIKSHNGKVSYEFIKEGRVLNITKTIQGYGEVKLIDENGKHFTAKLHRVVAKSFIDNPEEKTQVNHKDGNKLNNICTNLEWVTPSENTQHAYDIGLTPKIKTHAMGVHLLKPNDIYFIRYWASVGYSFNELANVFPVKRSQISKIVRRVAWNHI